ncbi:DUF1636 domain-containing protein [Azospirillum doebereinerae]|uniref:DUF1636 domain-containing protein n=1 Tax=Azospirillum doebereinerae TaxID=92933 RepID=A0A3S0V4B4_9PROT|nr:DUF1636 domain-containing protein [Azospirillum doebereinerae]MCG5243472.1 DUF1636 domain-containing protein [Azospirillum doebereinerae]RUQ66210.1 DUF1636 domain-containing protein [Azospirillum doebereinerae]
MPVELIVCETCRLPDDPPEALPRAGAVLVERMERALAGDSELAARVRLRPMRCLMSCRRACAVAVRSAGRMSYVLGDLPPDDASVETLTAYLRAYAATTDGIVPFKQWPQGVKGRFVSRMPPLEAAEDETGTKT